MHPNESAAGRLTCPGSTDFFWQNALMIFSNCRCRRGRQLESGGWVPGAAAPATPSHLARGTNAQASAA